MDIRFLLLFLFHRFNVKFALLSILGLLMTVTFTTVAQSRVNDARIKALTKEIERTIATERYHVETRIKRCNLRVSVMDSKDESFPAQVAYCEKLESKLNKLNQGVVL